MHLLKMGQPLTGGTGVLHRGLSETSLRIQSLPSTMVASSVGRGQCGGQQSALHRMMVGKGVISETCLSQDAGQRSRYRARCHLLSWSVSNDGPVFLVPLSAPGSASQDTRVSTVSTRWMSARTSHARTGAPVSTW